VNAERAEKRARAIYEAALFSTLMQQESEAAAASEDEFDFDVTLRETLVRMISKELLVEPSTVVRSAARGPKTGLEKRPQARFHKRRETSGARHALSPDANARSPDRRISKERSGQCQSPEANRDGRRSS
jgi:hypothetical protein